MRVAITHRTLFEYDAAVVESVMDARLGPRTDEDQRWDRFDLRTTPPGAIRRYADGFGNVGHLLSVARAHRSLEVTTNNYVVTLLADPFQPPRTKPSPLDPGALADHLRPTKLVPLDDASRALAEPKRPANAEDAFTAAQRLMHLVHERFTYRPDVTTVATAVPEVLRSGSGVCQDLAHVLLGLLRSVGIPARYASGYIVTSNVADAPKHGAGASHAWVEAFTPTHGWRGLDPTNDLIASEHHVKMAVGRDYRDVPPTRGSHRGDSTERLTVTVVAQAV
jgi:transglutaminase-like putative cysteine protease